MEILFAIVCPLSFVLGGFVAFWAFKEGLKLGQRVDKDIPIAEPKQPKLTKVEKKIIDERAAGIANLLSFDGTEQK